MVAALMLLLGIARAEGEIAPGSNIDIGQDSAFASLAELYGKRIGVVTGAIQGPAIEREIPEAELRYFNSVPDLLAAARAGKIDAFSATPSTVPTDRLSSASFRSNKR